ncbi:hypothetical protein D3C86_1281550 [compost metagenome]
MDVLGFDISMNNIHSFEIFDRVDELCHEPSDCVIRYVTESLRKLWPVVELHFNYCRILRFPSKVGLDEARAPVIH